ncbi:nucleotidyltransferase family protein [Pelomonas sp. SE-A7]|uniref:nucleotidyltransferase domain-containing protein n=1 Tax=Pelomonas sp. SE-A7 TaxID=3054953 RepID=UPI00259C904B|nr:nucleotidyltransferase family protein [Pelomonas sp. SE-A7]MDM4768214.1 nucleotidyltransferase family protein [Pelomonas sp. SE-A7]
MAPRDLLTPLLSQASGPWPRSGAEWELLLRQARRTRLQASLALEQARQHVAAPAPVLGHFEDANLVAQAQGRAVRWELIEISRALRGLQAPVVVLKGAAYLLLDLPFARGRLFSDIDLLVHRDNLPLAEAMLSVAGWQTGNPDEYDQRYYRQWMHEIPPLVHGARKTVVDLHHNILPLTSRVPVDAELLLADIVPLEGWPGLYRLADVDLVLHMAVHLFMDGEFDKGLRDLCDLHGLLTHFGADARFWERLQARAERLGMGRTLYYALRYAKRLLGTEVPSSALTATEPFGPAWPGLMDALFQRALRPDDPSCEDGLTGLARWLLYWRGHWLRMPLHLLVLHLTRKTWRRIWTDDDKAKAETA